MARIRSVHPGQWRDEEFVECSFAARLLAIAVRNEADDQGIFEWKPKTLKMNIFPADAIEIVPLLEELERRNIIKRFEVEGRVYGAIRNFRAYQRPKSPNATYPLPDELREYVAIDGRKGGNQTTSSSGNSEIDDDDGSLFPHRSGNASEIAPQMEEGGDKMKEEGGKKDSCPPDVLEAFELWNEVARDCGLSRAQKLTKARSTKIRARLGDIGGLEGWRAALEKIRVSRFLRGENKDNWSADLDFVLQESKFTKLMEGGYDDRRRSNGLPRHNADDRSEFSDEELADQFPLGDSR